MPLKLLSIKTRILSVWYNKHVEAATAHLETDKTQIRYAQSLDWACMLLKLVSQSVKVRQSVSLQKLVSALQPQVFHVAVSNFSTCPYGHLCKVDTPYYGHFSLNPFDFFTICIYINVHSLMWTPL